MTTVVIKLGGHVLDDVTASSAVLRDIAADVDRLTREGVAIALVHGGGPQIAGLLRATGAVETFHDGLRVTTPDTMTVVARALGHVNQSLVAAFQHLGVKAWGVSGVDGALLTSPVTATPLGRVALNTVAQRRPLDELWSHGYIPIVSPVTLGDDGGLLNCNADVAAGAIAAALTPATLLLLTDIDQLRRDPQDAASAIDRVSSDEVRALIESGAARDGMRPKMLSALDALAAGATRVVMANGTRPRAVQSVLDGSIPYTEVVA